MYICPQCASSVDIGRLQGRRDTCPDCGAPLRQDLQRPWIDVARVTNLAEAGFLTDELVGLGIDARIHQLQDFSAVADSWASLYLIRVPAGAAHDAAARIRQHLAEDSAEQEADPAVFRFSSHDEPFDPLFWRPVALVVLAGVASFVLGQRFSDRNDAKFERRPPRDSLASAVEAIGQPLVSESAPGQPRHRLSFDRQRGKWFLDLDHDGDGQYDNRRAFQGSGAAW